MRRIDCVTLSLLGVGVEGETIVQDEIEIKLNVLNLESSSNPGSDGKVCIPDEGDRGSGVMSITIPG